MAINHHHSIPRRTISTSSQIQIECKGFPLFRMYELKGKSVTVSACQDRRATIDPFPVRFDSECENVNSTRIRRH